MVRAACHRSLGVIRIPLQERSRWLTALLFMHTISSAVWTVPGLLHSQEIFTADGSHQICLGHLRASLAVADGKHPPGHNIHPSVGADADLNRGGLGLALVLRPEP